MRIVLNGEIRECVSSTLEEILEETGHGDAVVATALNGSFVPVVRRPATPVVDGDKIEVLAPMQGG